MITRASIELECKKPAPIGDYPDGGNIRTTVDRDKQDVLYAEASSVYGAAIRRLARAYDADPDKQRDLLQEMHMELWVSLRSFDGRCSLQTWVYRIANNVGASHVVRSRRVASRLVDLETLEAGISLVDAEAQVDRRFSAAILLDLIHRLKPLDRQVILLYLDGEAAGSIAEVTGLSATNVATKIHRIKGSTYLRYAGDFLVLTRQWDERLRGWTRILWKGSFNWRSTGRRPR
ncbi:MAG: sigma-70 family RNA polymerase sigma factor [Bryobacteraceae bacterium]